MLLTLALMVLALGVLAVGTREATVASAVLRKARAERAAEAAITAALREWSTRAVGGMAVGEERHASREAGSTVTVRLDSGLFLLRGEGRVPGPHGDVVAAAGLLVRTPPSVAEAVPGAITATEWVSIDGGEVEGGGEEDGSGTGDGAACDGASPGVVAPVVDVAPSARVAGSPPVDRAVPPAPPTPDPLAPAVASRIADVRPPGRVARPRPATTLGECAPGPGNWGSPDPGHPCHRLLPVVYADGDLTVLGGVGRGVLVVAGDLRLAEGARFDGLIVVHGHLEIAGGAEVRGAVRARLVRLRDGAVTRDGCAVEGIAAAPALDGPFRPAARWWVPVF